MFAISRAPEHILVITVYKLYIMHHFFTNYFQDSKNCKKELNYADAQDHVNVVPIMAQKDWKASGWLGIITAGLLWMDFRYFQLFYVCDSDAGLINPRGISLFRTEHRTYVKFEESIGSAPQARGF